MVRLFFRNGPFDGGSADYENQEVRKPRRKGERRPKRAKQQPKAFPNEAYVACGEGSWFVWCYRHTRTITPHSAEYTLAGWVKVCDVESGNPILFISP